MIPTITLIRTNVERKIRLVLVWAHDLNPFVKSGLIDSNKNAMDRHINIQTSFCKGCKLWKKSINVSIKEIYI